MRLLLVTLYGIFALSQQDPAPPKSFTPEQLALQQKTREVDAERQRLRAAAKSALDAEMAREQSAGCAYASTADYNQCYSKVVEISDQNFKIYEDALRGILGLRYPEPPGQAVLTPSASGDAMEFDKVEQLWHSYLDAASLAAFHQFDGGTGGPSFDMETHVRLVRSHLRELDTLYGLTLRN
jgi:hypothetical protein